MNNWWMRAERAVADTTGRPLDAGGHSIRWKAEINTPPRSEAIVVTGYVDDLEEDVEIVVGYVATSHGGTIEHADGTAETSAVVDGVRVVVWGVDDRDAFNALAQRLVAARDIRRASAGEEVAHAVA